MNSGSEAEVLLHTLRTLSKASARCRLTPEQLPVLQLVELHGCLQAGPDPFWGRLCPSPARRCCTCQHGLSAHLLSPAEIIMPSACCDEIRRLLAGPSGPGACQTHAAADGASCARHADTGADSSGRARTVPPVPGAVPAPAGARISCGSCRCSCRWFHAAAGLLVRPAHPCPGP